MLHFPEVCRRHCCIAGVQYSRETTCRGKFKNGSKSNREQFSFLLGYHVVIKSFL